MLYIYVLLSAFLQHLWTIWTANQNSVLLAFTGQHKQCWFLIGRRVRRQIWHCNEHYFCRSHDPLSANDCQHFWWWYNNKTVYTMLAYDAHWDQMLFTAHGIFLVLMVDHIHSVRRLLCVYLHSVHVCRLQLVILMATVTMTYSEVS